jgi:hypothetical protein
MTIMPHRCRIISFQLGPHFTAPTLLSEVPERKHGFPHSILVANAQYAIIAAQYRHSVRFYSTFPASLVQILK